MGSSLPVSSAVRFSRQEYWSGLCPSPGIFLTQGLNPCLLQLPLLQADFFFFFNHWATKEAHCFSVAKSCLTLATPWTVAHPAPLSLTTSWNLLKLLFIESVLPSNYLILCYAFFSFFFPSIRVFSSEQALHFKWPKYWSFSVSSSNEYSGLISFRIDWFDHLAIQGEVHILI